MTVTIGGDQSSFVLGGAGVDSLKRALGCAVVMLLPPEGLDEAVPWLRDVLAFYSYPPTTPALLPANVNRTATIKNRSKRAPFILPEEP